MIDRLMRFPMPSWRFFILLVLLTLCQSGVRVKSMTTWVRKSDARNLLQDIEKDVCNGLWFDFRYLIGDDPQHE